MFGKRKKRRSSDMTTEEDVNHENNKEIKRLYRDKNDVEKNAVERKKGKKQEAG